MRNIIIIISSVCVLLILVIYLTDRLIKPKQNVVFGITFSAEYAEYLGFDYKELYKKIIKESGFNYIRLMSQWDEIEKVEGTYDFSKLDWLMKESDNDKDKVVLVVGRKTPRWPECHLPAWVKAKEYKDYKDDLAKYMSAVVTRYKDNIALEIWQVENEPFLAFGDCKVLPVEDLTAEIELVRKIDGKHKILITDSGELSTWRKTVKAGDLFGTTMYRVVWDKMLGYFSYNWLPSVFYQAKLKMWGQDIDKSFIIELQAEPWIPGHSVEGTPIAEQNKSMDIDRLKDNVEYAQKVGMPRAYLWGVEWWYWMEKKGDSSYLEFIKTLKK